MNIDWALAGGTVVSGLLVVFGVLCILVFLCFVLGQIFKAIGNRKAEKETAVKKTVSEPKPSAPVAKAAAPAAAPAPVVERGIPNEVVAAIGAAVACMMGPDQHFAVRSVKRAKGARPVWNVAGIADNTRPF